MRLGTKLLGVGTLIAALGGAGVYAYAQHGPGFGHGPMGMGMMGMGHATATVTERGEIHDMLMDHDKIRRTVTNLPNGIRTVKAIDGCFRDEVFLGIREACRQFARR